MEDRRRAPRAADVPSATLKTQTPTPAIVTAPSISTANSGSDSVSGGEEERLRAKTISQQKRIDQLMAEKTDLVSRIDQLERNTLEICTENNAQRSRLEEAQTRCRKLEEENTDLCSELQSLRRADQLAALQSELEEKISAARDLQRKLTQSETVATQRARTIDALEEDVRIHVAILSVECCS